MSERNILSQGSRLFDVFVTLQYSPNSTGTPQNVTITKVFPESYANEGDLKQIPDFAYPCSYEGTVDHHVEHYSFVFIAFEPTYHFRYAFCRMSSLQRVIHCFLSDLPWFEVFYTFLNKLTDSSQCQIDQGLLETLYNLSIPSMGEKCVIQWNIGATIETHKFEGPDTESLPCVTDRNLAELYSAVTTDVMIRIFASILNERRLLITSKRLSRLTACCHASLSLIFPLQSQCIFIPLLPQKLIEHTGATMPFVMGVHASLLPEARKNIYEGTLILDADTGIVEGDDDDRDMLPSAALSELKKSLKPDRLTQSGNQRDYISGCFLRCLASLLSGYRDGFKRDSSGKVLYDKELYVQQAEKPEIRAWRHALSQTQLFFQFVEEKVDDINNEVYVDDMLDLAINEFDSQKSDRSTKAWATKLKKTGNQAKKQGVKGVKKIQELGRGLSSSAKQTAKLLEDKAKSIKDKTQHKRREIGGPLMRRNGSEENFRILAADIKPERPPRPPIKKAEKKSPVSSYKIMSFTDDDLDITPDSVALSKDPAIMAFMQAGAIPASQSAGSLVERALHSTPPTARHDRTSHSTPSNIMQSSAAFDDDSTPIAPPRRNRKNAQPSLLAEQVGPEGTENDGFSDNFQELLSLGEKSNPPRPAAPLTASSTNPFSDSFIPHLTAVEQSQATTNPATSSQSDRKEKTFSSALDDLAGLDLSLSISPTNPMISSDFWRAPVSDKPNYHLPLTDRPALSLYGPGYTAPAVTMRPQSTARFNGSPLTRQSSYKTALHAGSTSSSPQLNRNQFVMLNNNASPNGPLSPDTPRDSRSSSSLQPQPLYAKPLRPNQPNAPTKRPDPFDDLL